MTGSVRVQVTAAPTPQGWRFTLACPDTGWSVHRDVDAFPEQPRYPVPRLPCAPECDHELGLCAAASSASLEETLAKLDRREADGAAVGRYLFDTLLSADWQEVVKIGERLNRDVVELALTWPYQDAGGLPSSSATWRALSQLPWELMRDGDNRVLASAGQHVSVAVTRVVEHTSGMMPDLSVPPRVLFVVGTLVADPKVRAGAEMLGLLREVRRAGSRIRHRILENASPRRLREAMNAFRPDIVHVISHGELNADGRGYIWLESETDEQKWWTAEQLLELLSVDRRLPSVVILSACDTAGKAIVGPRQAAPFAAELVFGGIPVVVAMAGTVSDRACRVFTRYFGRALAAGESLVAATAKARRLAFAETASASADWALPSVFFSAQVTPDNVRHADDPGARDVDELVALAGFNSVPVFCARENFLQAFWAMLGDEATTGWEVAPGQRPSVLAISVLPDQRGVGKTRLLEELAKEALQSGHLPLLLGTGPDEPVPLDLDQLAGALAGAMKWLGNQVVGVDGDFGTDLKALARRDPTETRSTPGDEVATLADALESDGDSLCRAAKSKYPAVFGDTSRVVVLVDNVGEACVPLLTKLFNHRHGLNKYGLGASPNHPVPVVLVLEADQEPDIRHDLAGGGKNEEWLVSRGLKPFDSEGEDMLAYELVLLNPFRSSGDELTRKPWIFNRDPEKWAKSAGYARTFLEGRPQLFNDVIFDKFVRAGVDLDILTQADDDIRPEVVR
jgi:CHAT domain